MHDAGVSRIDATFAALRARRRVGLIPFITAGDPDPARTVEFLHALVAGGADIIELGVPFSDPMADGPVIQRASERALMRGITLERVLQDVRHFRADNTLTPVVLMGYANPVEQYGLDAFGAQARNAGVDGVLVVDYPPEEAADFARTMRAYAIDPIFLLAPTSTDQRIAAAGRLASGYLYYVALKGVTGAASLDTDSVAARLPHIQRQLALPLAVGFGIRDAQTACKVAAVADAVVIGSRIVQLLEEATPDQAAATLRNFMYEIRQALDAPALPKPLPRQSATVHCHPQQESE